MDYKSHKEEKLEKILFALTREARLVMMPDKSGLRIALDNTDITNWSCMRLSMVEMEKDTSLIWSRFGFRLLVPILAFAVFLMVVFPSRVSNLERVLYDVIILEARADELSQGFEEDMAGFEQELALEELDYELDMLTLLDKSKNE